MGLFCTAAVTFIVHLLRFKHTLHIYLSPLFNTLLHCMGAKISIHLFFSTPLFSSLFAIKYKTRANKRIFYATAAAASSSSVLCCALLCSDWWARIHYIQCLYNLHGFHCQCCGIIRFVSFLLYCLWMYRCKLHLDHQHIVYSTSLKHWI